LRVRRGGVTATSRINCILTCAEADLEIIFG
jgi:hypothetical protein